MTEHMTDHALVVALGAALRDLSDAERAAEHARRPDPAHVANARLRADELRVALADRIAADEITDWAALGVNIDPERARRPLHPHDIAAQLRALAERLEGCQ